LRVSRLDYTAPVRLRKRSHGKQGLVHYGYVPGDPEATGPAILKVVDAKDPPLRIFFGSGGLPMTRAEYARRIETWEKWNDVSIEAQGNLAAKQAR
jgi:hypothetical protein